MRHGLRMVALGSALGVTAITAPSMMGLGFAGEQDQDRKDHRDYTQQQSHPEYANNRYYQMGHREGYEDYERKTQRKEHNHKYRNDEDRRAHDYGYQQGWQGQSFSSYHNHDQDDHR